LLFTTKTVGTNLLSYFTNFVPEGTTVEFTDMNIEAQLDGQHPDITGYSIS
jgi:hypothetical protein